MRQKGHRNVSGKKELEQCAADLEVDFKVTIVRNNGKSLGGAILGDIGDRHYWDASLC